MSPKNLFGENKSLDKISNFFKSKLSGKKSNPVSTVASSPKENQTFTKPIKPDDSLKVQPWNNSVKLPPNGYRSPK
jgi:CHAT domain-containing protein